MPDTPQPGSSLWWVDSFSKVLDGRATAMTRLDDYYRGKHPLLYSGEKFRAAFGNIFAGFSDNFCALVADAVEERLDVQGFRMGGDADAAADKDAWRIWQANDLDAWSQIAHLESLVKGVSYVLVAPDEDEPDEPEITVQDAIETDVALDRTTHERLAAFKRWQDETGTVYGTLYLPDRIEKYQRTRRSVQSGYSSLGPWEKRIVKGETWPLANPLEEVPIVPLVNRPRLHGQGDSEIASIIPIQNAVNKLVLDLLVASEYAAFRQRWATGIEIPSDPDTGKPIEPFRSAVDRLWTSEDPNVKFGEFSASDLSNYVNAIQMAIQHVATISRTPVHYLNGQMGTFPSGESIRAAEAGLVSKARRKQRFFGEAWEEVMRLAFRVMGDPRAEADDSETIWADPETRTESEHVDALVKMGALGVPQEALWEKWGATPQEIARWKQMQAAQSLRTGIGITPFPAGFGGGRNGAPIPTTPQPPTEAPKPPTEGE